MGSTISSDTRRISFDNSSYNISAALGAEKCLIDDNSALSQVIKNAEEDKAELALFPTKKSRLAAACGDDYWLNRADHLQKEHQEINKLMEEEYEKTIEYTNKLLPKASYDKINIERTVQFQNLQAKVLKCYQDNPQQTLVCSSIVKAFNNCVAASRNEEGL